MKHARKVYSQNLGPKMPTTPPTTILAEVAIPNFLVKVWNIVEDEAFNDCIRWDDSGFSFHITDPFSFSKDVLPLYFKHNNLNSFVRQLNMYGFRKVTPLEKSSLINRGESDQQHLEFQHPYFVRGHPDLLQHIRRKVTTSTVGPSSHGGLGLGVELGETNKGMAQLLEEVRDLREKQRGMDGKLSAVQKENGSLWREVAHMRNLHMKQQQIVNKLIHFLLSVVQPRTASGHRLGKRQLLAIQPDDVDCDSSAGGKRVRVDTSEMILPAESGSDLRSLQKELSAIRHTHSPLLSGPIIADVTDEQDTLGYSGSPIIGSNVSLGSSQAYSPIHRPFSPTFAPRQPTSKNVLLNGEDAPSTSGGTVAKSPTMDINVPLDNWSSSLRPATDGAGPKNLNRAVSGGNEFGDFLEFMDSDLDSLREALGSQLGNSDFLQTLFQADEYPNGEQRQSESGSIVGNEVTLYQTPTSLFGADDEKAPTNDPPPLETPITSPMTFGPKKGGKRGRR